MDKAIFEKQIRELMEEVGFPADAERYEGLCELARRQGTEPLEDAVQMLRIGLKYLLFDLEATRRENRYLRQLLQDRIF